MILEVSLYIAAYAVIYCFLSIFSFKWENFTSALRFFIFVLFVIDWYMFGIIYKHLLLPLKAYGIS